MPPRGSNKRKATSSAPPGSSKRHRDDASSASSNLSSSASTTPSADIDVRHFSAAASARDQRKLSSFMNDVSNGPYRQLALGYLPRAAKPPNTLLTLSDKNDDVKGFALLQDDGNVLNVDRLFVKKQSRGRGQRLMQEAVSIAQGKGIQRVELWSLPGAVRFYEGIGFEPVNPPMRNGGPMFRDL